VKRRHYQIIRDFVMVKKDVEEVQIEVRDLKPMDNLNL
jgi:hypothetical protein